MACIGDEKREVFPVKAESAVGPGTYNTDKPVSNKPSYAPFSSLQSKFGASHHSPKNEGAQLGPGTPSE